MLTKQAIKMEVQKACALDPGLSDAITLALGYRPQWSKMDAIQLVIVWLTYKSLTVSDPEQRYYGAFLALSGMPEATTRKDVQPCPQ